MVFPKINSVVVKRTDPELEVHSIDDDKLSFKNDVSLGKGPTSDALTIPIQCRPTENDITAMTIIDTEGPTKARLNDYGYDMTDSDDHGDDSKGSKIDLGYHFTWSEDDEPSFLEQQGFGINVYESIRAISKEASKKIDAVLAVDHVDQLQEEVKKLRSEIKHRKTEFSDLKGLMQMKDQQIGTLELERDLYKADTTKLANDLETCLLKLRRIGGIKSPFTIDYCDMMETQVQLPSSAPLDVTESKNLDIDRSNFSGANALENHPPKAELSDPKTEDLKSKPPVDQSDSELHQLDCNDAKIVASQPLQLPRPIKETSTMSRPKNMPEIPKQFIESRLYQPLGTESKTETLQTVPTSNITNEVSPDRNKNNISNLTDSPNNSNQTESTLTSDDIISPTTNNNGPPTIKPTTTNGIVTPPRRYSTFLPVVEKSKRQDGTVFPIRYVVTDNYQYQQSNPNVVVSPSLYHNSVVPTGNSLRSRKNRNHFFFSFCRGNNASKRRNQDNTNVTHSLSRSPTTPSKPDSISIESDVHTDIGNIGILPLQPHDTNTSIDYEYSNIINNSSNINHPSMSNDPQQQREQNYEQQRPRGILHGHIVDMNQRLQNSIQTSEDLRRNIAMLHRYYEQQLHDTIVEITEDKVNHHNDDVAYENNATSNFQQQQTKRSAKKRVVTFNI